MALQLLRYEQYAPDLETLGLTFEKVIYLQNGVANGVWTTPNNRVFLLPAITGGYEGEKPMVPKNQWDQILANLRKTLRS